MFWLLGMRYMGSLLPESELNPHALEGEVSNYWITREVPIPPFLEVFSCKQHFGAEACLDEAEWSFLGSPSHRLPLHFFFFFFWWPWSGLWVLCSLTLNWIWSHNPVEVWVLTTGPAKEFPSPTVFYIFWVWTSPLFIVGVCGLPSMYCAEDTAVTKMWTLWSKMEFIYWSLEADSSLRIHTVNFPAAFSSVLLLLWTRVDVENHK